MIKTIIASGAVVTAFALASPAVAGPYLNVENNAAYAGGDDFLGSTTDLHVGYEGSSDIYGWYLQGGPAVVSPDAGSTEMELSGKIGGSVQATENFGVYAEASFITTDSDPAFGTKLGAKYSF